MAAPQARPGSADGYDAAMAVAEAGLTSVASAPPVRMIVPGAGTPREPSGGAAAVIIAPKLALASSSLIWIPVRVLVQVAASPNAPVAASDAETSTVITAAASATRKVSWKALPEPATLGTLTTPDVVSAGYVPSLGAVGVPELDSNTSPAGLPVAELVPSTVPSLVRSMSG